MNLHLLASAIFFIVGAACIHFAFASYERVPPSYARFAGFVIAACFCALFAAVELSRS